MNNPTYIDIANEITDFHLAQHKLCGYTKYRVIHDSIYNQKEGTKSGRGNVRHYNILALTKKGKIIRTKESFITAEDINTKMQTILNTLKRK